MNAELGMMNEEIQSIRRSQCRDATLGFALIQHSAFRIKNRL